MRTFFLNGKFLREDRTRIRVDSLGLLRGYGVFDYIRTYARIPFREEDHLRRFFRSARGLNLRMPYKKTEIKEILRQLLRRNASLPEMSFRLVLAGGATLDGRTSSGVHFFIVVSSPHSYPPSAYEKGIKLLTVPYQRPLPAVKSLNYTLAASFWERSSQRGVGEILYTWEGKVRECSTSNFFLVKKGKAYTPKKNILEGVTKKVLKELARKNRIPFFEKDLTLREALGAEEAFITATDKEVMPVRMIDKKVVGKGRVGETTKALRKIFQEYVQHKKRHA